MYIVNVAFEHNLLTKETLHCAYLCYTKLDKLQFIKNFYRNKGKTRDVKIH